MRDDGPEGKIRIIKESSWNFDEKRMPVKRKIRGRRKGDKGKEGLVQCDNCGAFVPRSKIQRVTRRVSLVRGDLARELKEKGAYIAENVVVKNLCISCAIHYGVLKVRARKARKAKPFI